MRILESLGRNNCAYSFGLGSVPYNLAVTDIPYDDKLKELAFG